MFRKNQFSPRSRQYRRTSFRKRKRKEFGRSWLHLTSTISRYTGISRRFPRIWTKDIAISHNCSLNEQIRPSDIGNGFGTTLRQLCSTESSKRSISEVLQVDTLRSLSKGHGLESRPAGLGQTDNCERRRKKGSQNADPTRIRSDWHIRVSVKLGETRSGGRRRNGPQSRGLSGNIRYATDWRGTVQSHGRLSGQREMMKSPTIRQLLALNLGELIDEANRAKNAL
jgi:hypothetical protein